MNLQDPLITSVKQPATQSQNRQKKEVSQSNSSSHIGMRKIKFILTLFIILFTSLQVNEITTKKLQHSRNFIRFLNFYLIEHQILDIYWAGQQMLNYPLQEYQLIGQVNQFLKRFQDTMKNLDQSVYGVMDFDEFLSRKNKIYLQKKQGETLQYNYIIGEGFTQPFQVDNIKSLKKQILSSEQIQITLDPFFINDHKWNLFISITTFSQTSIIVQINAHEQMALWRQHIATLIVGIALLSCLIKEYLYGRMKWIDSVPDYFVCVLLLNTFFASLDLSINPKWIVILDGLQCCTAWLLLLKFLQKEDDYHISFLIRKSYVLVGRLFVSFGPIFIAFTIFGYTLFCREAWQFSTFRRTFLTLFYISYYNATYESFVVTMRTNPISMIFFFSFVILFTICVYSGMLVSVFCSYVWNKRESKIKEDIINNLKIQCSECNYKYKYIECLKLIKDPKRSLKLSFVMQIDFNSADQRHKYKKTILNKLKFLFESICELTLDTLKQIQESKDEKVRKFGETQFFVETINRIKNMLDKELPEVQEECNLPLEFRDQKNKYKIS